MNTPECVELEFAIQETGKACFEEIMGRRLGFLDPKAYTGKLMEWAMKDPEFRVALFRFVDVLPGLKESSSVIDHAQAYFRPVANRVPGILQWGLDLPPESLRSKAAAALIRKQISAFGQQFIVGSDPKHALKGLRKIHSRGMLTTVDLLGEACLSDQEADVYMDRYLELIDGLRDQIPVNISVKLSALSPHIKAVGHDSSVRKLKDRLRRIFHHARESGACVYVDMEDTTKTDITLEAVKALLMEEAFRDWDSAGLVLQAYLRRAESDLERLIGWVRARGTRMAVRLVKGAYWDTETILAKLASWPIPVWQQKHLSDATYERMSRTLLDNADLLYPAFASHNLRSLVHAMEYARMSGVGTEGYEFQTLFGMADPIKAVFTERGVTVREYAPVGDMLTGMAYLVRRLLENTSNEGFIRCGYLEGESVEELLKQPSGEAEDSGREHLGGNPHTAFLNAPLRDFTIRENREAVQSALDKLLARRTGDYPRILPVIDGREVKDCDEYLYSDCPEDTSVILGTIGMAASRHVEDAINSLQKGFQTWREVPWRERAGLLFRVAELLEQRRADLTGLMILESGKPWLEADADVAEAIDFCRYYALQAQDIGRGIDCCEFDGEEDLYFYDSRGLCAVIGPWNFPLAIPCGMMSAALVTGNPVILKPAEQSTLVAAELFRAFRDAGMADNIATFLPGRGESVGKALVRHPAIDTIVFTGSKAVGMEIIREAAILREGQVHVKRVIAEMGGKNAIVVDEGADLDQAVRAVVYSAFGYAGQKCSACSRLYVHKGIYPRLLERLIEAVRSQETGEASDPSIDLGPVIDEQARIRIQKAINQCSAPVVSGRIRKDLPDGRYFPATLFYDVSHEDPIMRQELFGPVLAMSLVNSFEEGLERANDSQYALTGGVFSRHPRHLKLASRRFRVGNLYLNRSCTGALVGRQPFGGAAHSGVGSKAGGPDYLKQFVVPRLVCENTIRQGFAPMENKDK